MAPQTTAAMGNGSAGGGVETAGEDGGVNSDHVT